MAGKWPCAYPHVETSGVTIGVIGLPFMLFAQLLGQAASMRQELDEFV